LRKVGGRKPLEKIIFIIIDIHTFIITQNLEQVFEYSRTAAKTFKSTYREWIFGNIELNAIRAKDAEVIFHYYFKLLQAFVLVPGCKLIDFNMPKTKTNAKFY
jgi:hypothetical protein